MPNIINHDKKTKEHRKKSEDYLKEFVDKDSSTRGVGKHIPKKKKVTRNEDGMIGYF